jgi:hypothetical protein
MADIIEVPIEDAEAKEVSESPREALIMIPEPKPRGRPRGSVNRPKTAPKTAPKKRAARPRPEPLEAGNSTPEPPSPPTVRRPWSRAASSETVESVAPPAPTAQEIAAQVLFLLSNRRNDQTAARREKYRGWCPQ